MPLIDGSHYGRKERIRQRRQDTSSSSALNRPQQQRLSSGQFSSFKVSHEPAPQVKCILRAPSYPDELAEILGDRDEPYHHSFENPDDSDTSQTRPCAEDRALFNTIYRNVPRVHSQDMDLTKRTNMTIHFGQRYTMDAWYRSAYPAEYTRRDYMCVCCYCLDYASSDIIAERHLLSCHRRYPPGREIYRDGRISVWEVDGAQANLYCQNICLLAKSFLSSKALYRDVHPFLFYVLTEQTDSGPEFVGYFSKQKTHAYYASENPIQCVSCIMALPFTQNKGYGQFLIEFSYLLTKMQKTVGGPETPLSTLGERAFKNFWKRAICQAVADHMSKKSKFTVSSLSKETGMTVTHVVLALEALNWLKVSPDGKPSLEIDEDQMNELNARWQTRIAFKIYPEKLMWAPLF